MHPIRESNLQDPRPRTKEHAVPFDLETSVRFGVRLAGQIYDSTGSYDIALWISLGMGLLAAIIVAMPSTGIAKRLWPQFSQTG